jgi:hypothetical protein
MTGMVGAAEAGHGHFGGGFHVSGGGHWGGGGSWGGGVHVGGGGSFHWSSGYGTAYRPSRWWGGGGFHVGYYPHYWGWPSYYYFYPTYVPSYYGTSYYPVEASYSAPGYAAPVVVEPELPRFGIGLFGGAVDSNTNQATNTQESDFGLLGRLRLTPGLLVEGELGKTSYSVSGNDNVRVDRRLGGSLIYEIGAYNPLAPYLLAGIGVQQSDVGGTYNTTQDYGEVGVGLRYALTRNLHIAADIRAGSRATVSNDQATAMPASTAARMVAPPSTSDNKNEDYTRARLSAILYF